MIFKPWDCAQPDEWLPQSLRLCWGSEGGGGGGEGSFSGDSGGGGFTGGGDWGSSGSYDASGFDAGGIGFWGGSAYDASTAGTGMGGGGDWGSFGDTNYSGFNAPNPTFGDVAGPNPGVTTGGGDWGSAGTFNAAGTGGGPGGAMFGADTYGGGGGGGGGFWGSAGGGGDYGGGSYGGGGGGFYGGGGGGGGSFSSFGTGTLGGSNAVSSVSGPAFADTAGSAGGHAAAGPAAASSHSMGGQAAEAASEAGSEAEPNADTGTQTDPDAAPLGAAPAPEAEAPPEAEPTQQDSFASRFDAVAPAQQDSFASRFDAATPDAEPSAFGPQSLDQQSAGEQGKSGQQQDSFDSRFGFDTSAPSPAVDAYISGGRGTDFDYGPGQQTAAPNFDQVFADLGIQPGWNPAEQMAGRTGLAEPTDWAANPYQPSTDVSVGRDFNQAFDPFGDTPSGMDLAADQRSEAEPSLTFNEMWGDTPYSTLPSDQLSRSAQETLLHDFGYFPNPGYVQGPPAPTWGDRFNATMNAIIDPVAGVTMYPFSRGLDALMAIPDNALSPPSEPGLGGPDMATSPSGTTSTIPGGRETSFEYAPSTTAPAPDWGSVFEGAAPTEAQPGIEAFIPGGRETNFEYNVAPTQTPIDVEVVRSDDPSVPADPRGPPTTLPPAVEAPESRPAEEPESGRPAEQQPEARPAEQTPQTPPQEARPTSPSLIEQVPTPPSLVDMVPTPTTPSAPLSFPGMPQTALPPAYAPSQQPAPPAPPAQPAQPPDEHDDAPEPQDTSQPPQDPNAPRPPENIPGQVTGARGTYTNSHLDNPRVNSNYRDSGRTDYPQGRPGIDFRTARQAGIEPHFRIEDINVRDVDARLVERINRAMQDMPANLRDNLVATSGWRPAHRGEAHEHAMDPRTSQESVYTRYNPNGRNAGPAARPGGSNHGPGRAIDFRPGPALSWLRAHAREYGLETLGSRGGRPFDEPHIQLSDARGNAGARPSAQEQAEQRALDAQTRQAAVDRGLLAPGRGNQQAGVPTPRARPSDAPQPEVAQPRPPADIPPAALPSPTMPIAPEPRPPADIPAPILTPPARGQLDRAVQTQNALNLIKQSTAKLTTASGQAEFNAAGVVAAKDLARAGVPLDMARSLMTKSAYEGAEKVGYGPSAVLWSIYKGHIDSGIAAALQGYQPAKPGEVQGPPSPFAPGKQGAAPFGQQYADLTQSTGPAPENYGRGTPALQNLSPIINPQPTPYNDWGKTPAIQPPPPPLYTPDTPGQFSPFRGNEAALPFDTRFLAKGGHVDKDETVVVGEEGPEFFIPDESGTVVPHQPQPGKGKNVDRWPKGPAVLYPGRYGGVEREIERQTREAQNPMPSLIDMVDSGRLPLNAANWHAMLNDPALIALGRSRFEDRRKGVDPGTEQYGVFPPAPAPAAELPDPTTPMAQALGYGSIKRRPMAIGRQSY